MLVMLWTALFGCATDDPNAPACIESDRITVFFDADKDGFGVPGTERTICPTPTGAPEGFSTNDDDCNDAVAAVNPGAIEACDGRDNDCDEQVDEGLRVQVFYLDEDGDGFGSPDLSLTVEACAPPNIYVENRDDCDDSNASINPDAREICDGIDNNCNFDVDDFDDTLDLDSAPRWIPDEDRDGFGTNDEDLIVIQCTQPGDFFTVTSGDCRDDLPLVNPDAIEICNLEDDDCDRLIDDSDPDLDPAMQFEWWADDDDDGFGDPGSSMRACEQPWFHVDNSMDCDDDEPLLGLPAPWWPDGDGDGFGTGVQSEPACSPPALGQVLVARGEDCNDADGAINPDAIEICDNGLMLDNDCDGDIDLDDDSLDLSTTMVWFIDADLDGFGNPNGLVRACEQPGGTTTNADDCDDGDRFISPVEIEVCDGVDNDCDTLIDDADGSVDTTGAPTFWADLDDDGYGDPFGGQEFCQKPDGFVDNDVDCDDTDDTQLVFGTWLFDADGDGVGDGTETTEIQCTQPFVGYVPSFNGIDCEPTLDEIFPGNEEICGNGIDEDCSGADLECPVP